MCVINGSFDIAGPHRASRCLSTKTNDMARVWCLLIDIPKFVIN